MLESEILDNVHKEKRPARTKQEREKHLAKIAFAERNNPVKSMSFNLFAEKIAQELNISIGTAKKDIQEVRRRRRKAADIDQAYELGKKIEELAMVKEIALASNNINAYLGALNKECNLLGLDKFSIFVGATDDIELSINIKKQALLEKLSTQKTEAEPSQEATQELPQESQGDTVDE